MEQGRLESFNRHEKEATADSLLAEMLNTLNQEIVNGSASENILDKLFDLLAQIVPFDRIGIALIDAETDTVRLLWMRSHMSTEHLNTQYEAPLRGSSLESLLQTGQPRIINDLVQYYQDHPKSESTRLAILDQIRSSLTVPLISNGKKTGFVFFSSRLPHVYQTKHSKMLTLVANEISIIVEHGSRAKKLEEQKIFEKKFREVVHDLKSPLTLFKGYVEFFKEEYEAAISNPQSKKILEILSRNSNYMIELVNELSELQQLKVQGHHLQESTFDLASFLREIKMQGEALANSKNMHFILKASSLLPSVIVADQNSVRRVLENFLSNAFKFAPEKTTIELEVSVTPSGIKFMVSDQGPGIPESEFSKLFTEYGRTSVKPKAGEQSSGLGLSIAKKLIEANGGHIGFESKVGVGSKFWFVIPHQLTSSVVT